MVVNRIPGLIKQLDRVGSRKSTEAFVLKLGEAIGARVLMHLRKNQPVGESEPSYTTKKGRTISHGRPSHRLFGAGSDIGSSWLDPEVAVTADGGETVIVSTAPHIKYVMDKTKSHPISGPRGLSFWWGAPLRWNPVPAPGPGPRYYSQISHPGTIADPFVDKSIEDSRPENLEELRTRMREAWQPVRSFLS